MNDKTKEALRDWIDIRVKNKIARAMCEELLGLNHLECFIRMKEQYDEEDRLQDVFLLLLLENF